MPEMRHDSVAEAIQILLDPENQPHQGLVGDDEATRQAIMTCCKVLCRTCAAEHDIAVTHSWVRTDSCPLCHEQHRLFRIRGGG